MASCCMSMHPVPSVDGDIALLYYLNGLHAEVIICPTSRLESVYIRFKGELWARLELNPDIALALDSLYLIHCLDP